jgi:tetratricopeptide (TPR) repeat protein
VKQLLVLVLSAATLLAADAPELEQAKKLYNQTQFEASLKILSAIPAKGAAVYQWIGRVHYMLGDYKKATEALDKALAADRGSSEIALWAGRAERPPAGTSAWN